MNANDFLYLTMSGENISKTSDDDKRAGELSRTGGIPARTASGERLLLYVGIIDILQSYHIRKKLEHTFKSVLTDGVRHSTSTRQSLTTPFSSFF